MPRAGLDAATVTRAAAEVVDEVGYASLTMGLVADRLGVRAPSLYKHVAGQADLSRRIAVLAVTEIGDALRNAMQGKSERQALEAAAHATRRYARESPGRFAATLYNTATGPGDPLHLAWLRVIESHLAILSGYEIHEEDTRHALQMLRSFLDGFCLIEPAGDMHTEDEIEASFRWLIAFIDRGLRELSDVTRSARSRTAVASTSTSTSGSTR
ncbi:TetR/AcrR family transcriptional regulator [Kineococcus indalonis]|uniref:TetR/AcrR family transcriptional regulator n=1 Tax=Kineococcus indalonis TaxID=2696566 RepID=UPI0014136178|nr:TetR/AcrR family transcriptional regulator [Kineococcus indalonis]NAZ85412.1 TetR family transcriptional regulator [Kineococcus indalonis]